MAEPTKPVILYCVTGRTHLIYAVWSIRSLQRFGYEPIEVVVRYDHEKEFLLKHLKGISVEVLFVDLGKYNMFAFRPFVLSQYQLKHRDRAVVVCDADIIFKLDPAPLFERFRGKHWFQKILAINPKDLTLDNSEVSPDRKQVQTMITYRKKFGLKAYCNYQLNAGLFMMEQGPYRELLDNWIDKVKSLDHREFLLAEGLFSLSFAELGFVPHSDRADIKYWDRPIDEVEARTEFFEAVDPPTGAATGYETAKHYFAPDQKWQYLKDVVTYDVDHEGFRFEVYRGLIMKKAKKIPAKLKQWVGLGA